MVAHRGDVFRVSRIIEVRLRRDLDLLISQHSRVQRGAGPGPQMLVLDVSDGHADIGVGAPVIQPRLGIGIPISMDGLAWYPHGQPLRALDGSDLGDVWHRNLRNGGVARYPAALSGGWTDQQDPRRASGAGHILPWSAARGSCARWRQPCRP